MNENVVAGLESRFYETSGGTLHALVGGDPEAEAVLLLHGFPQSSLSWRHAASDLVRDHRVVCLDLKGYGRSDAPEGDGGTSTYAKRTMAQEAVEVMSRAGSETFNVVGHDRGALVAYRMALDHPTRVGRLGILDNLPVSAIWDLMREDAEALPHWRSLARPGREAEDQMTEEFMLELMRVHTAAGSLDAFGSSEMADYRHDWSQAARRHAFAEDYRAGATTDLRDDRASLADRQTIRCPTLIMWGERFLGRLAESPLETWRRSFIPEAEGLQIECGHFLLEEAPEQSLAGIRRLLSTSLPTGVVEAQG